MTLFRIALATFMFAGAAQAETCVEPQAVLEECAAEARYGIEIMRAQAILGGGINQAVLNDYIGTEVSITVLAMECAPNEALANIDALTGEKLGFMQNKTPETEAFARRISAMESKLEQCVASIGVDVLKAAFARR